MACRAMLKVAFVLGVIVMYLVFWYACSSCLFWLAGFSCAASVLGAPFMAPACAAGVAGSLLKGVHLGSGPLHFDVQWDG